MDAEKRKAELFSGSAVDSHTDLNQPNPTYPSYPFTPSATTASNTSIQPSATVGAPSPYTPYANTNTNIPTLSQPPPSSLPTPLTSSRHIDTDLNLILQPGNITPTRNNNNIPDTTSTNNINNSIDMKSALLPQYMATKHSAQKSNFTSPNSAPIPMYTPTTDTEYMNSVSKIQHDIYGTNNSSNASNGIYTNTISNTYNNNSSSSGPGSSRGGRGDSSTLYVGGDSGGVSYIGSTTLDLTKAQAEVDSITALLSYDLYNNNSNSSNVYTHSNDTNTADTNGNSKPQRNSISSALHSVLNDTRLSLSAASGPKPENKKDSGLTPPHNYDLSSTSSPSSPPLSKVSPVSTNETNSANASTQSLNKVYTNSSVKSIKQYWKQMATSTSAPSSSKGEKGQNYGSNMGQNYDHPSGYNTERSLPSSAELLYTTAIGTNLLDNTQNNSSSKGHNSDRMPSTSSVPIVLKYTNINSKNVNTKILNTLTSTTHGINNYNNNSFLNSSSSDNKQSLPLSKKPRTATNNCTSSAALTTTAPDTSTMNNATITTVATTVAAHATHTSTSTPVSASKIPRLSLTSPTHTHSNTTTTNNTADITPYKPTTTTTTSTAGIPHNSNHNTYSIDAYNTHNTTTSTSISPVQTEAINDLVDRLERVAVTLEGHPDRFLSKLQSLLPLESNRLGWEGEEDIDLNQTLTTSNNHTGKLNDNTSNHTTNSNKYSKHIVDIQPVLVDKSSHPFHRVEVNFPLKFPLI